MSNRISRDQVLMESARLWAKRSTCSRAANGASIIRDGRILMSGYNGAPAGLTHCDHTCDCDFGLVTNETKLTHRASCRRHQPCTRAIHAEQNALNACARYGVATDGAEMYCTMMPCLSCSMSIISAGIQLVTFELEYRMDEGFRLLEEAKVGIIRYGEERSARASST